MSAKKLPVLRLPALRVRQGRTRVLFSFAIDGKVLPSIASVSRVGRDEEEAIVGYQRPEVRAHISEIRAYLESDDPLLPNAVVVAFDPTVKFELNPGTPKDADVQPGFLLIPIPATPQARKPGWIVDGQQRLAAVREARVERFPLCAVGFITADDREQREQFILVNNTKPLPKGLVYELLPGTDTRLPSALDKRRFPVLLLNRLNIDSDSPLKGMIQTPTRPGGPMKDNSLLKMLMNSLSDGALYGFRGRPPAVDDAEGMLRILKDFWGAVADTFPEAWNLKPKRSRLLHGAGVISLGLVMDTIAARHRATGVPTRDQFGADLTQLKPVCRWTEGVWDFGGGEQRKWNEIQNTPEDIQKLYNYLLHEYRRRMQKPTRKAVS